jgi:type IV pilus assembly protein PilB
LTDRRLGELLLDSGLIDERDLYRHLAAQRGLRPGSFEELYRGIDLDVVNRAPRTFLMHNELIPLCVEDGKLIIATSNPASNMGDLAGVFHVRDVEAYLVTPTDYRRFWSAVDIGFDEGLLPALESSAATSSSVDLLQQGEELDAHLVALFEAVLLDAMGEHASDIHFERYGERVRVRIRVDGELHDLDRYRLSPTELMGLVNIIKVRAHLDIAERRLPQGGRYSVRVGNQGLDLRVQTQPTLHGEHAVIRLLPHRTELMHIEQIGFPEEICDRYRRLLKSPAGLVLVVGPTGSGKSTTLYAGLQELAKETSRKVMTIEDPIEYSLSNVQQSQVRPEINFHFSDAMRVFVRQDPDVILVGEIRDSETALEALRASQTGHLVLSTLHSNDSIDAVQRMRDLEMLPNSIASELLAVIAQRLAKRICTECRAEAEAPPEILSELFGDSPPPDNFRCYQGQGCTRCHDRGTHGRVGIVEILPVNRAIRHAISHSVAVDELRQVALTAGFAPMREHAVDLVRQGVIPITELPRILPPERLAREVAE